MKELVANFHIHTSYSDGSENHRSIALAALQAGLDIVFITDHNILIRDLEGYIEEGNRKVLMLVGEEVHDQTRSPQKNHLLVFGVLDEMAGFARNPQELINEVNKRNGLSFIAHPFENALPLFNEDDITWIDWQVNGYTGIELWNGLSEIKTVIHTLVDAAFYAYFPNLIARNPPQKSLEKWDELLSSGMRIVVVGGTDAHALKLNMGPIKATIFPYSFHFRTINNHIFVEHDLYGKLDDDRIMVTNALRNGHSFVAYDLPISTKGFFFTAQTHNETVIMGDSIFLEDELTFQINVPHRSECLLKKDGKVIEKWYESKEITYKTDQPGVYRVECYINYFGKKRGWIFSNPIYVKKTRNKKKFRYLIE